MKDTRQRILDKLAKTQGVKKVNLKNYKVKLNEILAIKEAFAVDGQGEVEEVLASLDVKLSEAITEANRLIEIGDFMPEYYDSAVSMAKQLDEILGETPQELTDLISEIENYLARVSNLGYEYDSELTNLWDQLPKYV